MGKDKPTTPRRDRKTRQKRRSQPSLTAMISDRLIAEPSDRAVPQPHPYPTVVPVKDMTPRDNNEKLACYSVTISPAYSDKETLKDQL